MASFLSVQQALDQANHAAEELKRYSQLYHGDPRGEVYPQSLVDVPTAVRSSRKQLAEAAARLLQLTTDPREYLEQLAANVSVLVPTKHLVDRQLTCTLYRTNNLSVFAGSSISTSFSISRFMIP